MELRVLEYFLAVAREQNISNAAAYLHLTQPTLSRQLKDLEEELGKQLFIRGNRKITLTEDGLFLKKRAEEILTLSERTKEELLNSDRHLSGDIYIGTGESESIRNIIQLAHAMQEEYPDVRFHFTSGDSADLVDRLDKGLFDFCALYGEIDQTKYEYFPLPYTETWAVLMRKDDELANKKVITTKELWDKPLIMSRHAMEMPHFLKWLGKSKDQLNIKTTHNLVYTAALMVDEGMGYCITLDKLVNTEGTNLCFRPLTPENKISISLVWKKYKVHSKAAEEFINRLYKSTNQNSFTENK